jgi:tRNA(Ile)-lysidine synthase
LDAIKRARSGKQDWLGELSILVESTNAWIASSEAELSAGWPQAPENMLSIDLPASVELGGWRLTANEAAVEPGAIAPNDPFQAWLDMPANGGLTLRRRREGDRFQPLGLEHGSQKLSDFFVNEKMPARARAAWPLVTKGDEIVWVPGYRLAHPYRLRPDSTRALRLALVRL